MKRLLYRLRRVWAVNRAAERRLALRRALEACRARVCYYRETESAWIEAEGVRYFFQGTPDLKVVTSFVRELGEQRRNRVEIPYR